VTFSFILKKYKHGLILIPAEPDHVLLCVSKQLLNLIWKAYTRWLAKAEINPSINQSIIEQFKVEGRELYTSRGCLYLTVRVGDDLFDEICECSGKLYIQHKPSRVYVIKH